MTSLRWLLLAATIVIYRVWFPDVPSSAGVRLDYDLVAIALVGLYRGQRVGAGAGWLLGLLAHATAPDQLVWGGLLGSLLGWVVGHWRQRLFLEQLGSRWVVFVVAFFAYKLGHWMLIQGMGSGAWLDFLLFHIVPSSLIDATAGVLLGVIIERSRAFGARPSESATSEDFA